MKTFSYKQHSSEVRDAKQIKMSDECKHKKAAKGRAHKPFKLMYIGTKDHPWPLDKEKPHCFKRYAKKSDVEKHISFVTRGDNYWGKYHTWWIEEEK